MNQVQSTSQPSRFLDTIEILALGVLLAALVFFFNGITENDLFNQSLKDSGHTAVFFVATLALANTLSQPFFALRLGRGLVIPIAFFGGIITGVMIELIQPSFGREGSFLDVWYDLLGCTSAILVFIARRRLERRNKRILAIACACFLLSISSILPLYFHQVITLRNQAFPVIFNAEENWQNELFSTNYGAYTNTVGAPSGWESNESKVIRLDLSHGQYPGIAFRQIVKDWGQYDALRIDVFSKLKQKTNLVIRVSDTQHNQEHSDRFNRTLSIEPGINNIEILLADIASAPEQRDLSLNSIDSLVLFSTEASADLSLYLDDIRLERRSESGLERPQHTEQPKN